MVITTTKVQPNIEGSVAVEPSFDMPKNNVDSLGDENLADLAPTKKRRKRGRPKQESTIRRMDIIMKRPDNITKLRPNNPSPKSEAKASNIVGQKTISSQDFARTNTPKLDNYKPLEIHEQHDVNPKPEQSMASETAVRSGILIDSPVRPQNEISTHATAASRSYLPSSPLEGFNEVASDIETDSKASISKLLF